MDNLEDRQREMRERNTPKKRETRFTHPESAAQDDSPEVVRLKKRISELEEQVSALQLENNRLREQKTIVVERSSGDSVKQQQHNFFKYSNARKY